MTRYQPTRSPSYKRPPVVETALSIQFEEIEGFNGTHFGLYYQLVRDRYPQAADLARLEPIRERFPGPRFVGRPVLQFQEAQPVGRMWFVNAAEDELIQVQPNRFVFNWRKRAAGYPSFAVNQEKCVSAFREFQDFCRGSVSGTVPEPTAVEVLYVNNIVAQPGESPSDLFQKAFRGIGWESNGAIIRKPPEAARLDRVYEIPDQRGRLYFEASLARFSSDASGIQLNVTARVVPRSGDAFDLEAELFRAHDWVVWGFDDLTTKTVQVERWGRTT